MPDKPEKKIRVVLYVPESRHNWIMKHFVHRKAEVFGELVDVGETPSDAYLHLLRIAIQALEPGDENG